MSEASGVWVDATLAVLQAVSQVRQRQAVDVESVFRVPGDAEFYIQVVTDLMTREAADDLVALYLPTVDAASVVDLLSTRLADESVTESRVGVIRELRKVPAEWPWDAFIKSAADVLQVPNNVPTEQLAACLVTVLLLEEEPAGDGKAALAQTVQGGFILHHLESARSAPDFRAAALCVLAHLLASPEGDIQTAVGNAAQGQQWYRTFADSPDSVGEKVIEFLTDAVREFWDGRELLFTGRDGTVAGAIVARVIERLVARDQFEAFVPARAVIDANGYVESILAATRDGLLSAANAHGELVAELLGMSFTPNLCGLYEWALNQETTRERVITHVEAGLVDVSRDQWLQELGSASCVLNLVVRMVQYGRAPLTWPFVDALMDEVRAVLEQGDQFSGEIHRGNLVQALTDDSQGTFYQNLRDALADNASRPLAAVLAQYGQELSSSEALDDPSAADRVVRRVIADIVDRQVGDELHWAFDAIQRHPALMDSCEAASAELVRERLRAALESPRDGTVAPYLTSLATALGLEAPSGSEERESD